MTQYQDDLRLLKKAKRRIQAVLILSYLVICLWPAGMYFLLSQPIFTRPDFFTVLYLLVTLVQMVVWMVIFFVISSGKSWTRHLVLLGCFGEIAFCGWLIYDLTLHPSFIAVYLVWIVLEMVKNFYLLWLYKWLRNSWWSRIFFDHVITLSESERQEQERQQQARKKAAKARVQKEKANQEKAYASRQTSYDQSGHYGQQTNSYQQPNGYRNAPQNTYPQNQPGYGNGNGYPNGNAYPNHNGYANNSYPNSYPANGQTPGYGSQQTGYNQYPAHQPNGYGNASSPAQNGAYPSNGNQVPVEGRPLNFDPSTGQYYDPYTGQVIPTGQPASWPTPDSQPGMSSTSGNYAPQNDAYTNFGSRPDITSRAKPAPAQNGSRNRQAANNAPAKSQPVRVAVKNPVDIEGNSHEEAAARRQKEKENRRQLSSKYPRTAIRMAIVVYGELILFPLIVHLFQNNFVSIDNASVFALNLMFTLCILTGAIWTLPIFFLYLKQPGCKKILWFCVVAQIGVAVFGGMMLKGYYDSDTVRYSMKVFTLFLMLEVLRYGLLIVGIFPAFKLPEIKDDHSASDDDLDDEDLSDYEFELVDEQDPDDQDEDDDYDDSDQDDNAPRSGRRILSIFTHKDQDGEDDGYDDGDDYNDSRNQNQYDHGSYQDSRYDENRYDNGNDEDHYEEEKPSFFSRVFGIHDDVDDDDDE